MAGLVRFLRSTASAIASVVPEAVNSRGSAFVGKIATGLMGHGRPALNRLVTLGGRSLGGLLPSHFNR
jgi:hypothetical protein